MSSSYSAGESSPVGSAAPGASRPVPNPSQLNAMPGRLLGIDAGGSGTRAVVLEAGEVTPQPDGPPMNALRPR